MNTDTPGVAAAVSVMLAVLVYLLGDAYGDMYEEHFEKYQNVAKEAIAEARNMAERAVTVGEQATDQSEALIERNRKIPKRG